MGESMKKHLNENYTLSGKIDLYHFSKKDLGQEPTLDPIESAKQRNFYSLNDYRLSNFPRVFYYTDYRKAEPDVKSMFLYKTSVDGSKILMLKNALEDYTRNSDELKSKDIKAWEVVDALKGRGYTDWDSMFETADKNYIGVYYETGRPVVNIFKPLKAKRYVIS